MDDLDLLIEAAAVHGQLASGAKATVIAARATDKRLLTVLNWEVAPARHNPVWTEAEEEYLRASLGQLSEAEIAAQLGRSVSGVHIHWKRELRLPAPSKDPRRLTSNQVAEGMGVDSHVAIGWFDSALFFGRRLPSEDQTRVVERVEFLRWLLEPASWIYFNPRRVGQHPTHRAGDIFDAEFWAEARRQLDDARRAWGDEWWTTRRVADYHRIDTSDVKRHIQLGRLHGVQTENRSGRGPHQPYWRLWFIRRSEAITANLSQYSRKPIVRQETHMDITPTTRQVTDFTFTISSDTLERYLADPQAWADEVRAQLNGSTPGEKKARKAHTKNERKGKAKCPQCGKILVSPGMLERHLRQKHSPASPDESASAA